MKGPISDCHHCGMKKIKGLTQHMRHHHPEELEEMRKEAYRLCANGATYKEAAKTLNVGAEWVSKAVQKKSRDGNNGPHKCLYCDRRFLKKQGLYKHEAVVHPEVVDEKHAIIRMALENGSSREEIRVEMGVSDGTITAAMYSRRKP